MPAQDVTLREMMVPPQPETHSVVEKALTILLRLWRTARSPLVATTNLPFILLPHYHLRAYPPPRRNSTGCTLFPGYWPPPHCHQTSGLKRRHKCPEKSSPHLSINGNSLWPYSSPSPPSARSGSQWFWVDIENNIVGTPTVLLPLMRSVFGHHSRSFLIKTLNCFWHRSSGAVSEIPEQCTTHPTDTGQAIQPGKFVN